MTGAAAARLRQRFSAAVKSSIGVTATSGAALLSGVNARICATVSDRYRARTNRPPLLPRA
ncbi:hypothetical protein [Sphingomonas aracearum]|uniref:hypothetical protein n=1 Tax=Sphingomonas aracearum TaxID=2283317 RepID=UPI0011C01B41|nr:hypothetical protein [Sphingomonas aracearum]